ncbi:MAG: type IV pilus assembly protein PilM [Candidatus Margulisbacteria bacterium]|nr:type IV pilus assembly protein PilM [Candidatus Margulisiibacteriota bacterium]MBU1617572.1 type IV pilus assembly protein PilM [Candidatus Margulisiibacteriota bacterium]
MPWKRSALGIDLRVSSVKVVEVEITEQGPTIKKWGITEIPAKLQDHPEVENAKADALRKLLDVHGIKAKEAYVAAGGELSAVKLVSLVGVGESEVAEAIRWKFTQEIPFPIEEAIIDFYPLPKEKTPAGDRTNYVAACLSSKTYHQYQHILSKAGLNLAGINVLPLALQELYQEELAKSADKLVAVIYLGKKSTNISIFRKGIFEFNRDLPIGGDAITLAMSGIIVSAEGKAEISLDEAEKIKMAYGIPINAENFPKVRELPISQLQAMVRPALEKVLGEIARTIEYYKGQSGEATVNKIILTGGSSLTPNFKEFLEAGLGIPIEIPKLKFDHNPRLSAAIGAVLAGKNKINLLPDDVKNRWKLISSKLSRPVVIFPAFFGVLAAVYLIFWAQAVLLQQDNNYLNARLTYYQPRLTRFSQLEKDSAEEEQKRLMMTSFKEKRTQIPRVFEELSNYIPVSVTINSIKMTINSLHLWGTAYKYNDSAENILSYFVLNLSTSPVLEDVQLVQAVKNYQHNVESFNFEIVGRIKE